MDEFSRIMTIAHLRSVRSQMEAAIELEEKAVRLACLTGEQPESIIHKAREASLAGDRAADIIEGWINQRMEALMRGEP